jgi:hemerythrin-like domain-containing protein
MCSYCGCENIEVVGRFMREHTEIINASGVLRAACDAGSQDAIAAAAAEVARLFAPHSAAEEAGIFTVMAEDPEFTDYVTRLCSEHEQLNAHLAAIVAAADDANRHAAYEEFELLLRGHIDREDNSLFPAAAVAFAGPEWERVAALTPDA